MNFRINFYLIYSLALLISSMASAQQGGTLIFTPEANKKKNTFSNDGLDFSITPGFRNQKEKNIDRAGYNILDFGANLQFQHINQQGILIGLKGLLNSSSTTIYEGGSLSDNEVGVGFNHLEGMLQVGHTDLETDENGEVYGLVLACGAGYADSSTNSASDITGYESPDSETQKSSGFTYRLNYAYFFKNKAEFQTTFSHVFNGIDSKQFKVEGIYPIKRFNKNEPSASTGFFGSLGYQNASNKYNTRNVTSAGIHYGDKYIKLGTKVQLVNIEVGTSSAQRDTSRAICPAFFFSWNLAGTQN
jgi:hypothetical protein